MGVQRIDNYSADLSADVSAARSRIKHINEHVDALNKSNNDLIAMYTDLSEYLGTEGKGLESSLLRLKESVKHVNDVILNFNSVVEDKLAELQAIDNNIWGR